MTEDRYIYLNRDLSWLSFNHRVLLEAADASVPLYSRINFLSIFSSNLDEFFRVRMPSIFAFTNIPGKKISLRDDYPKDLVENVQSTILRQQQEFGRILTEQILPGLREKHIHLYYGTPVRGEHEETVREYFLSRVLSFLQPVLLRQGQAPIFLENNALYFLVELQNPNQRDPKVFAVLNIPSDHLPRFLRLPQVGEEHYILFLDDVIRMNLQEVFPGYTVIGAYSIKLTRDAEMSLEDEFTGDLAEKIEKQLSKRDLGHSTRFLYEQSMPEDALEFVHEYFSLRPEEMIEGGRYHNLRDLSSLPDPTGSLSYAPWPPVQHRAFSHERSIFTTVAEAERMVHPPYHSYNQVLRFFNEAAIDPLVREIYVTLYRVAADSHIANALISAAKNGKKVTVFVELKARFDEANNLRWSKKMKAAGVRIINSIPGLKVHAKVALVKRWEDASGTNWKNFSFLGTGNFNETTGRFYCDHAFYSTNPAFSEELEQLFRYLESRRQPADYGKLRFRNLLVSQFNLVKRFRKLIDREIEHAKSGRPARIIIKLNNLQERDMIDMLYAASNAGVRVDLIVRSICCLAPGIRGQSENIVVRRIVDRYLEHARVFVFHNDGSPEYFLGSADWMNRNLHRRIEVCFPVREPSLCEQLQRILDFQLDDNSKAVFVKFDPETGSISNERVPPATPALAAQAATYDFVRALSE